MHWLEPEFLFLFLALPALWFWPRGGGARGHRALRTLVFALLILALAQPVRVAGDPGELHVFVVDLSASTAPDRAHARLTRVAELAAEVEYADLIAIGDEPTLQDQEWREPFERIEFLSGSHASPLSATLAAAARAIPDGSRGSVTVISDGLATDRRWGPVVQDLCARSIPVHTMQLPEAPADLFPVRLRAAEPLRLGRTARLFAELSGEARSCDLVLTGPRGVLARVEGLDCAGRARAVLEFEPASAGYLEVELRLERIDGANSRTDNDSLRRTLAVDEARRALYLGERLVGGDAKLGELVGPGLSIEAWDRSELTVELLADYDLAIIDDLPSDRLGEAGQRALVGAVTERGLGLFAGGGQAAFGPGGYHQGPLAEILPVEMIQRQEKRDPSTTLVVIIDTSGSMGGNRVQLAKEVARLAIRRLLPHDKVGIVEFYGAKRWAAPIQPASNAIELERALNRLDAGGGTVILPAIEEAFYGMKNVQTRYKHVLVLTDGGVETGAFEPLLRSMADDGLNVSTVLIGAQAHSEFLVTLANWGKGRFYSVPNRFNLPEILLKQPASAKLPAYRPGTHPVQPRGGSGWWGDVDLSGIPPLAGYVETRERPGAEVLLETVEGAIPVLSTWRYGLGRVTAFPSEATGPGTEPWRDWDDHGRFLARVMERTASDQREPFRFEIERRGVEVIVSAARRYPGTSEPRARVVSTGEELGFRERAPGRFESRLAIDPGEELRIIAESRLGSGAIRKRLVSNAREDVAHELQVDPLRALDLAALSRATGGQHLAFEETGSFTLAAGGGTRPVTIKRLWPWLALLALLTYLAEIFYRRRPGLYR
jgi:Ca-activated chloride channel homolog